MGEQERWEPQKETIERGDLFYLCHPEIEEHFIGLGLSIEPGRKDRLVGLLMVDRPHPADPDWLQLVANIYGECQLVPITSSGERGLACQMQIAADSLPYLRQLPSRQSTSFQWALEPLLDNPPRPTLIFNWDEQVQAWHCKLTGVNELPAEIREVFERTGYGCLEVESTLGVVYICHMADAVIDGLIDKPVWYQWNLIEMPSAPLIRLDFYIVDDPNNPFGIVSYLNVGAEGHARLLDQLMNQDQLFLAFYGDNLDYRYIMAVEHDAEQLQKLGELVTRANIYWESLPPERRDFDRAKAEFIRGLSSLN
jgi:hypothetical protein